MSGALEKISRQIFNVAEEGEIEGRYNVIKDSGLSKEQSPWGG